MKTLRDIEVTKDCQDIKGIGISKGTILHVIQECPRHPLHKYRLLQVRVDNGTGQLDLMPETVVRDNEVN